jgi:hypothetical protein
MTDDATFARDLRTMLARRDPGPVSSAVTVAIRGQILADRRPGRFPALGAWAGGAAAVGAIAAVIVFAIVIGRPPDIGPGASPSPLPQTAYAMQPGDGLVIGEHEPVVQTIVLAGSFFGLILLATQMRDRRKRIGTSLGALVIAFAALNIGTSDAIAFRDGGYGVDPARVDPAGGMQVAVTGDRPFTVMVTMTNTSRLPLTIVGLAGQQVRVDGEPFGPRLVALGHLRGGDFMADAVERFVPITLGPSEQTDLAALGLAGPCALASIPGDSYGTVSIATLPIVYEQLTIVHTAYVNLPDPIVITVAGECPLVAS